MIRSPIKWAGGKSRIRNRIVQMLPEHTCYVEVFGGAAWVLFAKSPSDVEILNDIDNELINFFEVVKSKPKKLLKSFEWDLVSRKKFYEYRYVHAETLAKWSDIERAHRFFYLIMASWGGEMAWPRLQTSVSDKGGHGNRLVGALKKLEARILPTYERLQTVIIENLSWEECIARYDRPFEKTPVVMYLDPPYPGNNVNYEFNMTSFDEHKKLATVLQGVGCKFLLSTYDIPEVKQIYSQDTFNVYPIEFSSGMPSSNGDGNHRNKEVVVTNFPLDQINGMQK